MGMTLTQIINLLKQQSCALIEKKNDNPRMKSRFSAGNVDIHALQTIINDHRTMIDYLIDNSINATFMADAISNHHSKTGPILTSWCDLVDLFVIIMCIGFIIYFLICRAGFSLCDRCFSFIFKHLIRHLQEHEQQKQATMKAESIRRKRLHLSSTSSISDDIVRFNNRYIPD